MLALADVDDDGCYYMNFKHMHNLKALEFQHPLFTVRVIADTSCCEEKLHQKFSLEQQSPVSLFQPETTAHPPSCIPSVAGIPELRAVSVRNSYCSLINLQH